MSTSAEVLDYINALKWPVLVGTGLIWQRNSIKKAIAAFWERNQGGKLHGPGFDLE